MASGSDEAELIAAWQRGDRRAGDALLRRHLEALRHYLQRSGGPVEDLMQETLLQCMRTIGSFRGDARFRTFLLAVANNVWRTNARRATRAQAPDDAAANELASELSDIDALMDRKRVTEALQGGLALLPEHVRRVIELQYWGGLTSDQIAAQLVVPAGSVRRWQTLARKELLRVIRVRASAPGASDKAPS